jgi:YaiO family outer membrane protein
MKQNLISLTKQAISLLVLSVTLSANAQVISPTVSPLGQAPAGGMIDRPTVFDSQPYVEGGVTFDKLTNNRNNWNSQYANIFVPLKENGYLFATVQNANRFAVNDQGVNLTYAYPFSAGILNLDLGYTFNAQFLPQSSIGLGWNGKLPENFGYIMSANQQKYSEFYFNSNTNAYSLGLEKYIDIYRLAYVGTVSTVNGTQPGYSSKIQLQRIDNNDNRIGLTGAFGTAPTVLSPGNLTSLPSQYVQLDGLYWITKSIGITSAIWFGHEGIYYDRTGFLLGLRAKF